MSASELGSGFVQFGGLRLHHTFGGRGGTPLLMIHGLGSSGYLEWRRNLEALAANRRVLAPDLPGFGRSEKPALPYGISLFVQTVEAYADAQSLDRFDLVGTSLGGRVAIEVAARDPGRVRRLALVNALGLGRPNLHPFYGLVALPRVGEALLHGLRRALQRLPPDELRRMFGRGPGVASEIGESLDDRYLWELRELHEADGFHYAYLATVRSLVTPLSFAGADQTSRLAATGLPVLLIWGARDRLFPLPLAEAAQRRIPGSRLAVIERAGHTPQAERPDEFNRALVEFLDS